MLRIELSMEFEARWTDWNESGFLRSYLLLNILFKQPVEFYSRSLDFLRLNTIHNNLDLSPACEKEEVDTNSVLIRNIRNLTNTTVGRVK